MSGWMDVNVHKSHFLMLLGRDSLLGLATPTRSQSQVSSYRTALLLVTSATSLEADYCSALDCGLKWNHRCIKKSSFIWEIPVVSFKARDNVAVPLFVKGSYIMDPGQRPAFLMTTDKHL